MARIAANTSHRTPSPSEMPNAVTEARRAITPSADAAVASRVRRIESRRNRASAPCAATIATGSMRVPSGVLRDRLNPRCLTPKR